MYIYECLSRKLICCVPDLFNHIIKFCCIHLKDTIALTVVVPHEIKYPSSNKIDDTEVCTPSRRGGGHPTTKAVLMTGVASRTCYRGMGQPIITIIESKSVQSWYWSYKTLVGRGGDHAERGAMAEFRAEHLVTQSRSTYPYNRVVVDHRIKRGIIPRVFGPGCASTVGTV